MMIKTTLTDEQLVKFKEAITLIRNAGEILTELAGPCDYTKGETRTMLKETFMNDALTLQPIIWDLMDSYEGCVKYKQHINQK